MNNSVQQKWDIRARVKMNKFCSCLDCVGPKMILIRVKIRIEMKGNWSIKRVEAIE